MDQLGGVLAAFKFAQGHDDERGSWHRNPDLPEDDPDAGSREEGDEFIDREDQDLLWNV